MVSQDIILYLTNGSDPPSALFHLLTSHQPVLDLIHTQERCDRNRRQPGGKSMRCEEAELDSATTKGASMSVFIQSSTFLPHHQLIAPYPPSNYHCQIIALWQSEVGEEWHRFPPRNNFSHRPLFVFFFASPKFHGPNWLALWHLRRSEWVTNHSTYTFFSNLFFKPCAPWLLIAYPKHL